MPRSMDEEHTGEEPVQAAMTSKEAHRNEESLPDLEMLAGAGGPPESFGTRVVDASSPARPSVDHGATKTLEKLFQEHSRRVFQAAYRITGNAMDAEDVLQTVFLR